MTYQFNDEKHTITVNENEEKKLGTFPIGNYNLKATKIWMVRNLTAQS